MNREELLKNAKPILFNTEMVQAILEGRKTVTRRVVKYYSRTPTKDGKDKFYKIDENLNGTNPNRLYAGFYNNNDIFYIDGEKHIDALYYPLYFKVGDILYVRETFNDEETDSVLYAADKEFTDFGMKKVDGYMFVESEVRWKPSIHMPKVAARIFLKVTDVRVERLQDITQEDVFQEGLSPWDDRCADENWRPTFYDPDSGGSPQMIQGFSLLWNSTIKKQNLDKYSWEANPFVWAIEFERVWR